MKKFFTEPDIEILKFLCNDDIVASPGDDIVPGLPGGDGAEGTLPV